LDRPERKLARIGRLSGSNPPSLILLNPLYLSHWFSIDDKTFVNSVCPAMSVAAKKLKIALDKAKNGDKSAEIMSALNPN